MQIHHKGNLQFTTVCFKLVFFFMQNNVYNFLLINTYLKMTKMSEKQKNRKTSIFHIVIMEVSFTRKRADNLKKTPTNNDFIALNFDVNNVLGMELVPKYEEFEDTKGAIRIVYRRRTDNTMTKRKSTKRQITIFKTYI